MEISNETELKIVARRIWRCVHRPETFAADVAKYIASEMKLPGVLMAPFVPMAKAMLRGWEDAAVEYTEYAEYVDGSRTLRSIFLIHNYSNSRVYNLIERCLKLMGVGKCDTLECEEVDFAWRLLGGVLSDYASRAGVTGPTTDRLLDFRLRNSDYETVTTWRASSVEIANLNTGRIESLELPARDIEKIVDWAVNWHRRKKTAGYCELKSGSESYIIFDSLMKKYEGVVAGCEDACPAGAK